jgi:hypothetical protein
MNTRLNAITVGLFMAGLIPLSSHAVTAPVISDSYISPSVASPISQCC